MTGEPKTFDMGILSPRLSGVKAEIHTEQEIADSGTVHVCARVEPGGQVPVKSSAQMECALCHARVWVAPSGQAIQAFGKNPIWCLECAAQRLGSEA